MLHPNHSAMTPTVNIPLDEFWKGEHHLHYNAHKPKFDPIRKCVPEAVWQACNCRYWTWSL